MFLFFRKWLLKPTSINKDGLIHVILGSRSTQTLTRDSCLPWVLWGLLFLTTCTTADCAHPPLFLGTTALSPRGLPPSDQQIGDGVEPLTSESVGGQLIPGECLGNRTERDFTCYLSYFHCNPHETKEINSRRGRVCVWKYINICMSVAFGNVQWNHKWYPNILYLDAFGTYSGKEACVPHFVHLKSSIRRSQTMRIWKEKQRECINTTIRKYVFSP